MRSREYPLCGQRVFRTRLPNGLAVLILPKPGFHKKFAGLAVSCGGTDMRFCLQGEKFEVPAGMAHFLEHMLFEMPEGSALEHLAAGGARVNAFTSPFETMYHITCAEGFYEALQSLLHFVMTPHFTPEILERERKVILQEIAMGRDDPMKAVHYGLLKNLFPHHPIHIPVVGTEESVGEITAEHLEIYRRAFYRMRNMVLCVVGDVEPELVVKAAQEALPDTGDEIPAAENAAADPYVPQEPRSLLEMEVSQPVFRLGARIRPGDGEDVLHQELTAKLALSVLLGSSSSLYADAYEQGLIDSRFSWSVSCRGGIPYWTAGGKSRSPASYCAKLGQAAEDMAAWGVDEALLQRQKRSLYGSLLRQTDDPERLCREMCSGFFREIDPLEAFTLLQEIGPDEIQKWIGENAQASRLAISVVNNSRESR